MYLQSPSQYTSAPSAISAGVLPTPPGDLALSANVVFGRAQASERSSEKVAASNLPSPSPSGEPPAEGAVAFSTRP